MGAEKEGLYLGTRVSTQAEGELKAFRQEVLNLNALDLQ